MQHILLLLSKSFITPQSLISHKYSECRAIIRVYIYPTWRKESRSSAAHRDETAYFNVGRGTRSRLGTHELHLSKLNWVGGVAYNRALCPNKTSSPQGFER